MPRKTVTRSRRREEQDTAQPGWDRKTGAPRDAQAAKKVARAYGRYSASDQSEERRKRPR